MSGSVPNFPLPGSDDPFNNVGGSQPFSIGNVGGLALAATLNFLMTEGLDFLVTEGGDFLMTET